MGASLKPSYTKIENEFSGRFSQDFFQKFYQENYFVVDFASQNFP